VHAIGRIGVDAEGSGRVFWNTREPEEGNDGATPFAYVAGSGTVVRGWDAGAMGAREGEVRVLRVPAAEAYGDEGLAEWGIPPRADLTFELEVVEVNKRGA
jgi:FKBP-type peptidyl-prolyl cis-trans isomerase